MCGVNPSVETIFKFAHLRSKDFSFQTKSAHSDSPSAGGAGELCWKVTRQRMSSLKRSMCGRLWPDWRSNTSRSNTLVGRATRRGKCGSYLNLPATRRMSPKRCTRIVRATKSACFGYRQVIEITGGQGRNRTADAGLFRAALYQLSYLAEARKTLQYRNRDRRVSTW